MKTKLLFFSVIAGIALTGCSSTQTTTGTSDSDSIATMQDTMIQDTMRMDTIMTDTTMKDTTAPQ